MELFQHERQEALFLKEWEQAVPGLIAGFTTKNGGISTSPFTSLNLGLHVKDKKEDVIKNREILAELIEMPLENWVVGEQVHGTNIAIISDDEKGKGAKELGEAIKNVDGLLTNCTSMLTTAFYADCVPLFFLDPVTKWYGIAHAGWKGTVGEIAANMVNLLCGKGSKRSDIKVAIGPSISAGFYEVDDQVIQHIPVKWHSGAVNKKENGKYLLDLKKLNEMILLENDLKKENIDVSKYCTYRDDHLFYSHRRDQGKTGRMLGFIGFK